PDLDGAESQGVHSDEVPLRGGGVVVGDAPRREGARDGAGGELAKRGDRQGPCHKARLVHDEPGRAGGALAGLVENIDADVKGEPVDAEAVVVSELSGVGIGSRSNQVVLELK